MKILMVNLVDFDKFEGGTAHQLGLLQEWQALGHEVRLVSSKRPRLRHPGCPEPASVRFSPSVAPLGLPHVLDSILQIPAILHYRFRHGYRVLYLRAVTLSFVVAAAARLAGMHVVVEHNSWGATDRRMRGCSAVTALLERKSQAFAARLSNVSRCVTGGISRLLADEGVGPGKLVVIGNGTDLRRFVPVDRERALGTLGLDPDLVWLGFLGLMSPWQGVRSAIRALHLLRQDGRIRLILAGDGPEREAAERLAGEFGLHDRVVFLGHVPMERANIVMNCFDIALAPYTRERNAEIGLSAIKIRDYAAAGRTVVAADLPGVSELAGHGWLFTHTADDPHDLARVLAALAAAPGHRAARSAAARAFAEAHFGWDRIAAALLPHMTPPAPTDARENRHRA